MESRKVIRNLVILMIVSMNIGCDQITKTIVRREVDYNESIKFINNHLTLTKVENSGAFLSLGDTFPAPAKFILLSLLPLIALTSGICLLLIRTNMSRPLITGLCFVIGGGIANIYDRIRYGSVTDFLHIDLGIFRTGIFNMADVSIMAGMIIILFHLYLRKTTVQFTESI